MLWNTLNYFFKFSLQARQNDYDELQKRLEDFEARERLQNLETEIVAKSPPTSGPKFDSETQSRIDSYLDTLKKFQNFEILIRQMKVKKTNYQQCLERAQALNPDTELDMKIDSKLLKFIADIEKKIQRFKRKQDSLGINLKVAETELPLENDEFQRQVKVVQDEGQLGHALKLTEIMFHEQSQTENLLMDALNQLKNLYLCSYTFMSEEVKSSFTVSY